MTDDLLGPSPMHMYTTDFAYDGPIFLVPLSPSYPSSPVQANIEKCLLQYIFLYIAIACKESKNMPMVVI